MRRVIWQTQFKQTQCKYIKISIASTFLSCKVFKKPIFKLVFLLFLYLLKMFCKITKNRQTFLKALMIVKNLRFSKMWPLVFKYSFCSLLSRPQTKKDFNLRPRDVRLMP